MAVLQLGDPVEWGAKSLRIGGATDLLAALGVEEAEAVVRARGRWCSEVWTIYARGSANLQLDASAAMAIEASVEAEALINWVQPTNL